MIDTDMFNAFDINKLSEYTFFLIFAVVNLGVVFFGVLVMRQIALMNKVFTTPYGSIFSFIAFITFCISGGVLILSLFYLIPSFSFAP